MATLNTAVVKKIQKLLSLADTSRNNSEDEAKAALLKAQELMAQYHIDMGELDTDSTESCKLRVCAHNGNKGYRCQLATVIATNFRSKAIMVEGGRVAFFGHTTDSKIAKDAFEYTYAFIKRRGDHMVYEAARAGENTKGVFNGYAKGFLRGLRKSLDAQCTALKLVVPADVEDKFLETYPQTKKYAGGMTAKTRVSIESLRAEAAGYQDGLEHMGRRKLEK